MSIESFTQANVTFHQGIIDVATDLRGQIGGRLFDSLALVVSSSILGLPTGDVAQAFRNINADDLGAHLFHAAAVQLPGEATRINKLINGMAQRKGNRAGYRRRRNDDSCPDTDGMIILACMSRMEKLSGERRLNERGVEGASRMMATMRNGVAEDDAENVHAKANAPIVA